jgi:hypothetical protein
MIKDLTFGGSYKDENLLMEAMLLNPAEHGYAEDVLLFEIGITLISTDKPHITEFIFYITDGQTKSIYNATDVTEISADGIWTMTVHVAYPLRTEYLYHDIRLGFFYEPYNCIEFVEINH